MTQDEFNKLVSIAISIYKHYERYVRTVISCNSKLVYFSEHSVMNYDRNHIIRVRYDTYKKFLKGLINTQYAMEFCSSIRVIEDMICKENIYANWWHWHAIQTNAYTHLESKFTEVFVQKLNEYLKTTYTYTVMEPSMDYFQWTEFKEGSNTLIYLATDRQSVLRCPLFPLDKMANTDRTYENWILINPQYAVEKLGPYLRVPFFEGTTPSLEECADVVLRIFREKRLLLTDGGDPENFMRLENNEIICLDPSYGVRIDQDDAAGKNYIETILLRSGRYESMCEAAVKNPSLSNICTLIYLTKWLTPEEIKDEYLMPNFFSGLHQYRILGSIINVAQLEQMLTIEPKLNVQSQTFLPATTQNRVTWWEKVKSGSLDEIKQDLEQDPSLLDKPCHNGWKPLYIALLYNHPSVAFYLIQVGADIDNLGTDLHINAVDIALTKRYDSILKLLIDKGAKIPKAKNKRDAYHVIHIAAIYGWINIIRKCIEIEPQSVWLVTQNEETPLSLAIEYHRHHVARLIKHTQNNQKNVKARPSKALSCVSMFAFYPASIEPNSSIEKIAYETYRNEMKGRKKIWHQMRMEKGISDKAFDNWLVMNHPTHTDSFVMSAYDELPECEKEGWIAFSEIIRNKDDVEEAWNTYATIARSKEFKNIGIWLPQYQSLPAYQKAALKTVATSILNAKFCNKESEFAT